MDRWAFLAGAAAFFAAPLAAEAQPDQTVRKIGIIATNSPVPSPGLTATFWERMRELGWIEGQNLAVEFRQALEGRGQVQSAVGKLMQLKVDIVVMNNGTAARFVQDITRTVPVCVFGADLLAVGGREA